jgi:hypothetical protein
MADYYSLISRAIVALPQQTPDSRQAVYERARKALFNQLRSIQPPVAEADIAAEGRALEEAIARLELEIAAKNAPAPTKLTPPPPPQPRTEAPAAARMERAPEPPKPVAAAESRPAERSVEDAWRDTLAAVAAEDPPREPQRPAAPLPLPPRAQQHARRKLALAAVLLSLIAVVGGLAWYLRERPEDLAKLNPAETAPAENDETGKFGDRVGGAGAVTPPPSTKRATSVPVAQKAEMWVASLQEPDKVDRIYNASVVWRLENIGGGPGEPMSSAIRGDVDIPDAKMKLKLVFQKNNDSALSASHTINVSFEPAPGSPLGGVKAIGPIQMRRADAQSGEKVAGVPVPITENNFLIGLMRGDRETRNIQLMRSLSVIDLPLQLTNGRAATINMEKGPAGERVFSDAIDAWSK